MIFRKMKLYSQFEVECTIQRLQILDIKIIKIPKTIKHISVKPIQKTENVIHQDQFSNKLLNFSIIKLHCA